MSKAKPPARKTVLQKLRKRPKLALQFGPVKPPFGDRLKKGR